MKLLSKVGVVITLASMLFLSACGSSGGGGSDGDIVIGVLTPTTGASAKMGQDMNNAIKMAVEEINSKGGLLGKKIKLVFEDEACDPQTATAAANKLVSQNVAAVVGGYCSGAVLPATGVLNQAGIPWVITAANSAKIPAQGYNNIFLLNSTAPAQAQTAADYIVKKLKGKRIAIINDNSAYSVDLAERTRDLVKKAGAEVVFYEGVNPQEHDFSSTLTKLKKQNPDVTYWTGYYAAGGLLLKQFKQLGVSGAFGVGDGSNDPTIVKIAGAENAEDMFTTTTPTPQFQPTAKNWVQKYNEKYNVEPGPYSAISYDGMRLIADAIKRANSTDKEAVRKAIEETNGFDTFSGPISFKPDGEVSKSNFVVLIVKNGQYQLVE